MDNFEVNKIVGAVLGTALFVLCLSFLSDMIYATPKLEKQAYVVETLVAEAQGNSDADNIIVEGPSLTELLSLASSEKGKKVSKKCASCHNFEAGMPNKVGPNLYGVVDRKMASAAEFSYSSALSQKSEEGGVWDFESLNLFLEAPKEWLPGTNMSFVGIKKPTDRANIIAYLLEISPESNSKIINN
ncbi:MAG: cytochrome c family protein [Rhodobiaceae bacterium]|jgi:cytochrome c|nr:cytochrome c family protein [Rhodobiaceae bacterium]MBT6222756.1 cytochrome c family protein [Rhodobiaceae bacterium]